MPTKREREYYRMGFSDGYKSAEGQTMFGPLESDIERGERKQFARSTKKRKLSAWNKYVKNPRNHIKWKTGSRKGMLNLGVMATAFRRKKRR